jgi:hypothetical protein
VTRQGALRHGFTHEKVFKVAILNSSGEKLKEWEIVQYHKASYNPFSDTEVDHFVERKKGFVSGITRDGMEVSVTCESPNILIVEALPIQKI